MTVHRRPVIVDGKAVLPCCGVSGFDVAVRGDLVEGPDAPANCAESGRVTSDDGDETVFGAPGPSIASEMAGRAPSFPKGIEQARRDFMRDNHLLYKYMEARLAERTWKIAGDITSGACDQYGASNRCYAQQGIHREQAEAMREQYPNPRSHDA